MKKSAGCDFELFWLHYPRKVGRKNAERKWKKMAPTERDRAFHVLGLWKQTVQWNSSGGIYVPYASTYLNQERWKEEPWTGAFTHETA